MANRRWPSTAPPAAVRSTSLRLPHGTPLIPPTPVDCILFLLIVRDRTAHLPSMRTTLLQNSATRPRFAARGSLAATHADFIKRWLEWTRAHRQTLVAVGSLTRRRILTYALKLVVVNVLKAPPPLMTPHETSLHARDVMRYGGSLKLHFEMSTVAFRPQPEKGG